MVAHHVCWCLLLAVLSAPFSVRADQGQPTSLRLANGVSITNLKSSTLESTLTATESSITGHPRPPIMGFSPLVAIAISDQRSYSDLDFEHDLHMSGVPGLPYPPPTDQFIVGILDSGSVVNMAGEPYATALGLSGGRLTSNLFPIGGVSGQLNTIVSYPIGVFANGLRAIGGDGLLVIDQLVGHSNVAMLAAPEISCENGEMFTAVVGTPMLSFFTTAIRPSLMQTVTVGGETYFSPDVEMAAPYEPSPTDYPQRITMEVGGLLPVMTASYYLIVDGIDDEDPEFPTMLSLTPASIPFGGAFFATVGLLQGEPGPLNPIQNFRFLVDTGAQSSIIHSNVAANLNLPLTGDFSGDVCGIGGLTTDVPGYYIDYTRINAGGGAFEFTRAPFIVLDLDSPEGGQLDGILGMNFFWNRDIVFDPALDDSSFIHVATPLDLPYGDFDRDGDVDMNDFATFQVCLSGPDIPQLNPLCILADADGDEDIDQDDFGTFQLCLSGANVPADPACDP